MEEKRISEEKLLNFGFEKRGDEYAYKTTILGGQFTLFVFVNETEKISTKLFDNESGDEYVLHLVGGVGEFVGKIRTEIDGVLENIKNACFENGIKRSSTCEKVIAYIKEKYGDELEYLWEKFPTDAIWRRKDNRKWYALVMRLPMNKLGLTQSDEVDVMDVRALPETIDSLVDNQTFFKGYHMNKLHWLTFKLDGTPNFEVIKDLIDQSYLLAK